MDSGMISKIQKAKNYAQEPERVTLRYFDADFTGDHAIHHIHYDDGNWSCECSFFKQRGVCSHTMAMERLLESMLKPTSRSPSMK